MKLFFYKISCFTILGVIISFSCLQGMEKDCSCLYDYKLFKAIKKIAVLAKDTKLELDKYSKISCSNNNDWSEPNYGCHQVKNGLFLVDYNKLYTPWGRVSLTSIYSNNYWVKIVFCYLLFKKIKISFFDIFNSGNVYCKQKNYKFRSGVDTDLIKMCAKKYLKSFDLGFKKDFKIKFKKISEENFIDHKGIEVFVWSSLFGHLPAYKVCKVNDYVLPEAKAFPIGKSREYTLVKKAWKTLEEKYNRERRVLEKRYNLYSMCKKIKKVDLIVKTSK